MTPEFLNRLVVLAQIADAGGVSAAARRLGVAKSSVSRHVAELERETGARMLDRLGRGVALTAAGEALAAHGRAIAREARLAAVAAREMEQPRGTVRVATPAGIADALLAPMLAAFLQAYPGMDLEVRATDLILDLAAERVDVAFRIGGVEDGPFVARRLHEGRDIFVAAPAYLAAAPPVEAPADLARHPWIGFAPFGAQPTYAVEGEDGSRAEVQVTCRVTTTSSLSIKHWLLAGAGVARFPDFAVQDELAAGRLVRLLPSFHAGRPRLHAAYLPERARPANVRRLVEHAVRWFGRG